MCSRLLQSEEGKSERRITVNIVRVLQTLGSPRLALQCLSRIYYNSAFCSLCWSESFPDLYLSLWQFGWTFESALVKTVKTAKTAKKARHLQLGCNRVEDINCYHRVVFTELFARASSNFFVCLAPVLNCERALTRRVDCILKKKLKFMQISVKISLIHRCCLNQKTTEHIRIDLIGEYLIIERMKKEW